MIFLFTKSDHPAVVSFKLYHGLRGINEKANKLRLFEKDKVFLNPWSWQREDQFQERHIKKIYDKMDET